MSGFERGRAGRWRRVAVAVTVLCTATAAILAGPSAAVADGADTPAISGAASTVRPSASAFGTVPRMRHVTLSPDGRLLAWTELVGTAERVIAIDLATGATRRTVNVAAANKVRGVAWADDETLLVELSVTQRIDARTQYEFSRVVAAGIDGSPPRFLLMTGGARELVTGATIVALRTSQPKTIVMSTLDYAAINRRQETGSHIPSTRKDDAWISRIYAVDTRTGVGTVLASGTPFTRDWVVDANGEPVARSEWDPARKLFTVYARQGSVWREVQRLQDRGVPTLYGLTADGSGVLALGALDGPRDRLWAFPFDGSPPKVVVGDDERDVEAVRVDPYTLRPTLAYLGGAEQSRRWVDPDAEQKWRAVSRAFSGRDVEVYGRSLDGRRVLAYVQSPAHAPVYYFVDFDRKTADIIGEAYPGLVNAPLGMKAAITYAARDGTSIPAYLTLPPGPARPGLPLVVLPHGGPEARDDAAFDWLSQFLATRGYAVLQPQFRGSTGFGAAFRLAGRGEWGGLMQDDVSDGVKALVAQGVADPKRVCIVGASYGGYAALAGAALTPDLYACAVSIAGVADLPQMLGYVQARAGAESDSVAYWRDHIGSAFDPKVAQRSPARLAANVRAPILLLHGEDDTVVPIAQSQAMARALAAAGKSHTLVILPGEDHWLSRSATRIRVLEETERFLAQHLR